MSGKPEYWYIIQCISSVNCSRRALLLGTPSDLNDWTRGTTCGTTWRQKTKNIGGLSQALTLVGTQKDTNLGNEGHTPSTVYKDHIQCIGCISSTMDTYNLCSSGQPQGRFTTAQSLVSFIKHFWKHPCCYSNTC